MRLIVSEQIDRKIVSNKSLWDGANESLKTTNAEAPNDKHGVLGTVVRYAYAGGGR